MKTCIYSSELWLPANIGRVFEFFSDPQNLQRITPDWLDFSMTTPGRVEMRPGALIDYRLRIHGFGVKWQTEITAWEPPVRFVDEQRRGPYRLWVHEHRFTARDNGTTASDLVKYAVPGGWLIDRLFVRRDVAKIFEYRRQKLREIFVGKRES